MHLAYEVRTTNPFNLDGANRVCNHISTWLLDHGDNTLEITGEI